MPGALDTDSSTAPTVTAVGGPRVRFLPQPARRSWKQAVPLASLGILSSTMKCKIYVVLARNGQVAATLPERKMATLRLSSFRSTRNLLQFRAFGYTSAIHWCALHQPCPGTGAPASTYAKEEPTWRITHAARTGAGPLVSMLVVGIVAVRSDLRRHTSPGFEFDPPRRPVPMARPRQLHLPFVTGGQGAPQPSPSVTPTRTVNPSRHPRRRRQQPHGQPYQHTVTDRLTLEHFSRRPSDDLRRQQDV